MQFQRALCWIRRDLRLTDHTALASACASASHVAVVFIFDTTILDELQDRDDRRLTFIYRSLIELDQQLRQHGSLLLVRHGDPTELIPQLAEQLQAGAVFFNHDYEPTAKQRDMIVTQKLRQSGRTVFSFKDQVVFERKEILTKNGEPFKVFTPYKRAWLERLSQPESGEAIAERAINANHLASEELLKPHVQPWSLQGVGFVENSLWLFPGQAAGKQRLEEFMEVVDSYDTVRDFPAKQGTSGLSVHLRFGTISIREAMRCAVSRQTNGGQTWLSELIWREFYQMILDQFPHVVEGAFKAEYNGIDWPGKEDHFTAWCNGQTGYPIVDAAMRHFTATGWMHNRLRMVVASFLVKDLLIDWRRGEAWFARYLLDFDLAANNGGWQWSASTGCDAQPYFRIFNPVSQSHKFDGSGEYIRRWCPELQNFPDSLIHWPTDATMFEQQLAGCVIGKDYPAPIVHHATQRERALSLFKGV